jgi:hypothetical protein
VTVPQSNALTAVSIGALLLFAGLSFWQRMWGCGIAFTAMLVAPLAASVVFPLLGIKVHW